MSEQNRQVYKFDEFQIDVPNRQLRRDNQPVFLPAKAFDLLLALVENNGRLVEKDELFSRVWSNQIVEESNLTVHVSQIRKALGETRKNPRFIETVPGYGYRFIGAVENADEEDLIIETETLSRIVIEKEETSDKEMSEPPASAGGLVADTKLRENGSGAMLIEKSDSLPEQSNSSKIVASPRPRVSASLITIGLIVLLTAAFAIYFLSAKKANPPFERIKLTRLTNNGKVAGAAISPDGKFIAYVLSEADGNSLWVRQTGAANDTRILPPTKSEFWELTFTPDGSEIYYNLFAGDKTDNRLFRIPTLGGVAQHVPNVIAHGISFAPDGKRFSYIQPDSESGFNYLVVADADGANQRIIAKKPQPNTFIFQGDYTAWSPDGETIACLVSNLEAESNYDSIVGVSARDGAEKLLTTRKWLVVYDFEWLKDGDGLLVTGVEKGSSKNKIWFLSRDNGEIRPVTDDLNEYSWLNASTGGDSFIALQTSSVKGIYIGEANGDANSFQEIISEVGVLHPIVWTPDGRIIFRSSADGAPNFWTADADGANRRQLTAAANADERGMCLTPNGKHIVFTSWRSGKSNLWRVDADGTNLTQLTSGEADAHPQCAPDNQTVVYQQGILSKPDLWKISINGGEPVRLTDYRAKWGAISTDGSRISFFQMVDGKWRVGITGANGGAILKRLDVPAALRENEIRWSADDSQLFYIGTTGNVGNIFSLSLNESEAKQVTNFKTHAIDDFAFSTDQKKIAIVRSLTVSDVVLITNETAP